MAFKTIIFSLIILITSVCYGQIPVTKDKVLILVTNHEENSLYENTKQNFSDPTVRQFMKENGIQFIHMYGNDTTREWRIQNKVTYYPAVIYYIRDGSEFKLSKTVSGSQVSKALGIKAQVRNLLGMKAETYQTPPQQSTPSNHPLIPGSNSSPPVQYVAPPQRWSPSAPLMPQMPSS